MARKSDYKSGIQQGSRGSKQLLRRITKEQWE